jgi:hypothetical protein
MKRDIISHKPARAIIVAIKAAIEGTKCHFRFFPIANGGKKACFVRRSWWGLNPCYGATRLGESGYARLRQLG